MERLKLSAEPRETGKKGLGALRRKGLVPAIVYGRGMDPQGISLNSRELGRTLGSSAGMNAVIELQVAAQAAPMLVMMKDYQIDVLKHNITHMDLLKIDITQKVTVKVPIHVIGKAVGVVNGGIMEITLREIEVKSLPTNIPSFIEVDVTPLDIGNNLHLSDLTLPEGVEVDMETNLTIVSIAAPREEEAAPVAAEGGVAGAVPVVGKEEKAEGEAKPAEAGKGKAEGGKAEKKG